MSSLSSLAAATLPFFALVGLGAAAAAGRLVPASALPGLNAYTLYLALPALLFRLGAGGAFHGLGAPALAVYAAAALALVALLHPVLARRCGPRVAGFATLATAFPNSGFLGLPLLLGLLGPDAAGPVAATLLVDVFLTTSLCLWLAHRGAGGMADALRPVWRNPLPWAIAAGAAADALATHGGWVPAAPVDRVLALLGASATPVALFALGAMLVVATAGASAAPAQSPSPGAAAARRPGVDGATASDCAAASLPTVADVPADVPARVPAGRLPLPALIAAKLLLHPALVWAAAAAANAWGAPLSPGARAALVLTAALPCASNVVLLADRHAADAPAIARLVVASTLAALPAVLLWAAAVVPGG